MTDQATFALPIVDIPYDLHETLMELVVVMPLGWVKKESIVLTWEWKHILVSADRPQPHFTTVVHSHIAHAYWWTFAQRIHLPDISIAYDKVVSSLSPENILTILIPKILQPETIALHVL
jgi:HSP20 family molecular chaperone IbpA